MMRVGQIALCLALVVGTTRSVTAEGSCRWRGFDPQLDRAARSVGALAAAGDTRLLFAALDC